MNYLEILQSKDYDFLRESPELKNIMFITLGGSHAYGTNVEGSDLDIRGCALNSKEELLLQNCFEQVIDNKTDTVIYGFNKFIKLLTNCNPNVIELLGLPNRYYWNVSAEGELLLKNKYLFLSKKAIQTFGGYAYAQLRRLDNKAVRSISQPEYEQHVLNSIKTAKNAFADKYSDFSNNINLYLDDSFLTKDEKDIYMDIDLQHYPLDDYLGLWSEMKSISKDYKKAKSKRNERAAAKGKLGKHMMHLIRLYLMCIDILQDGEINTHRSKDLSLLMDIRNGKYLDDDKQPTKEFFEMVKHYQNEMEVAGRLSPLPPKPNIKAIQKLQMKINESIM